jgi:hypothetical protein
MNWYSISVNTWHELWHTDIQKNEQSFTWSVCAVVWEFFCAAAFTPKQLWHFWWVVLTGLGSQRVKIHLKNCLHFQKSQFIGKFTNIWQIKHASSVVCAYVSWYIPSKIDILQLPVSNNPDLWAPDKWAVGDRWCDFPRSKSCPLAGHGGIVYTSKRLQSQATNASWTSYGALEEFYFNFSWCIFLWCKKYFVLFASIFFVVGYLTIVRIETIQWRGCYYWNSTHTHARRNKPTGSDDKSRPVSGNICEFIQQY